MPTAHVATFLLPPLAPLLAAFIGYLLLKSRPRLGRGLMALGWGSLALLSTPLVGTALLSLLETPSEDPLRHSADAIVVLAAGIYIDAPEYGGNTVNSPSLVRLRYAARLYQRSGKPILVSGGDPLGSGTSEAALMKAVLQEELQIPVAWTEETSTNTLANARNSDAILARSGIRRVYLVTHAWHMPRARFAFERAGFEVISAPTNHTPRFKLGLALFLPGIDGLLQSSTFCREILGLIWYRLLLL